MVGHANSIINGVFTAKSKQFLVLTVICQSKHMKLILNHDFGIGKIIHVRKIKTGQGQCLTFLILDFYLKTIRDTLRVDGTVTVKRERIDSILFKCSYFGILTA